jgi:pyruvate/2-oxoglutarate dehydrogenase complex dihydrolipoamide acyltransferase (E2) component
VHTTSYICFTLTCTDSLHAEGDKTMDTADSVSMVLEILEDCYVARILRQEGETVAVGQPIALLCEEPETLKLLQDPSFKLPPSDMQLDDEEHDDLHLATWQGFLDADDYFDNDDEAADASKK